MSDSRTNSQNGNMTPWESLVTALRAELQEYGGLLRLLDAEQDRIFADPATVATPPEAVARQHALAMKCTHARMGFMPGAANRPGRKNVSAQEVSGSVPSDVRPLLSALFSEVDKLALRAADRTHQNDWLRRRAPALAAAMEERRCAGN